MIVVQTPLRTSFVGGGTDFEEFYKKEGGCVLSSSIDKYVYVVLKERFDDKIYINYSRKEIVDEIGEVQHGLVREAMKVTGVKRGIEITTLSDVPSEGTGLGSSSSITVGLLHALHTFRGELKSAQTLAEQACKIEIETLGKPIGIQDQYIAAFGNLRFLVFEKSGKVRVESVRLTPSNRVEFEDHLLLFYTNVTRPADAILRQQKAGIQDNLENLRVMGTLAIEGKKALENGDFDRFGTVLQKSWERKKKLAPGRISNDKIDRLFDRALKAGALGGKITGAGGGGFLLLFCPPERQGAVRKELRELRELRFRLDPRGTRVMLNSAT